MLRLATLAAALLLLALPARAEGWDEVLAKARGQTVYWNAWAGDNRINAYIQWVADEMKARHGVAVQHVKLTDTAEAVARVLAEKTAGRHEGGTVDLIWINGENFAAMKRNGLLFGPWAERLPNWRLVDIEGKPTTTLDFTVPTDGLESPWGMAQVVFMYDAATVEEPPTTMAAMLAWAKANPGRLAYPQPPNFLGATFLKQALYELAPEPRRLLRPVEEGDFARITERLWAFIDTLNPALWRGGKAFPANGPAARRLLGDGEIDITISFNPAEASSAIANGELPDSVRTFVMQGGTIGNTSFVAIPYNASAKEGAMAVANFLLSPEAQARRQDPRVWGGGTVLDLAKLAPPDRERFQVLPLGIATLPPDKLGRVLPEPHPSWTEALEKEWTRRYAAGK